jgi:hypothetical protein
MNKHIMHTRLLRTHVVIECSCGWMQMIPRRSDVFSAMQAHRETAEQIDPRILNLVYTLAGFR